MSDACSIVEMSAWEMSGHIHSKKISCTEVMQAYLKHIDRVNPKVNAIVAMQDPDELMAQAREKDSELASGKECGWMHGFPQAVKDLEDTKGIVTTYGSPIFKDHVPASDSDAVAKMKAAGSIIIGKTNTPEWGYGSQTYNEVYGATANPYNHRLTCGGSSGGAACALAMRMQAVADGSDCMGSLRNPAGWCNVYGFRPSWGRVPSAALDLFLNSCVTKGPMARTVTDLALLLSTLSGRDERVPSSIEDDANLKTLTAANVHGRLEGDMNGKKVAWLGDWEGYLPMESGVLSLCEKALEKFSLFGAAAEPIKVPYNPEVIWNEIWLPFRHLSTMVIQPHYDNPNTRKLLKPEAVFEYEGSANCTMREMYNSSVKRSEWYRAMLAVFEKYDYIAVPTAQMFPFDKNIHWPKEIAGKKMDTYHRWMEVVIPWTLAGNPVIALPAGFNEAGLSMGIQLIGRPRSDFDLLRFAYAYEKVCDLVNECKPNF